MNGNSSKFFINASILVFARRKHQQGKIVCVIGSPPSNQDRDLLTLFGHNTNSISRLIAGTQGESIDEFYVDSTLFLMKSFSRDEATYNYFSLVIVFPNGYDVGFRRTKKAYSKFLRLLIKCYEREEKRCGYITDELEKIYFKFENHDNWKDVEAMTKETTRLANELDRILYELRYGTRLQILINGCVILGFLFPKNNEVQRVKDLRIHNSCVISQGNRHLFPPDGLKDIKLLEKWLSPRVSIQGIAQSHILSISLIAEMVKHLLDWGVLRMIPKLTDESVLVSSFKRVDSVAEEHFKENFKFPLLLETLRKMKEPKTYEDHYLDTFRMIGMEKQEFENGIIWLIENEYVKQLQTYVQFFIPVVSDKYQRMEESGGKIEAKDEDIERLRKMEESQSTRVMNKEEREYVKGHCTVVEEELLFLDSILGYCDGDYSIQEIMSIKGIERRKMDKMLEVFKSVLYIYQM